MRRPFADLLAVLESEGLTLGVSERIAVAQLTSLLAGADLRTIRAALASVVARSEQDVLLVTAAFDRFYRGRPLLSRQLEEGVRNLVASGERKKVDPAPALKRWLWRAVAGLIVLAGILLLATAGDEPRLAAIQLKKSIPPASTERTQPTSDPPRIELSDTIPAPSHLAWIIVGVSLLATALPLLWRLRRVAAEGAVEVRTATLPSLPGPFGYVLAPRGQRCRWDRAFLDDVATVLGRRDAPSSSSDIDVARTIERSLSRLPVPQLVFSTGAARTPLVILEDIGEETRYWSFWIDDLLDGLEARGAAVERWRFHGDGSRVFRQLDGATRALVDLRRQHGASPFLVVSAGEGVLSPHSASSSLEAAIETAPWVATVGLWKERAWLHPVPDRGYWRPQLAGLPEVLPLTEEGVAKAVERLIPGKRLSVRRQGSAVAGSRDVLILRWLLSLAPQATVAVAEELRLRFRPRAPRSTLLEALESPATPGRPSGAPEQSEVVAYLLELLAGSQPEAGTEAHHRWLLDRAGLDLQVPTAESRGRALETLRQLSEGPFAGEARRMVSRLLERGERSDLAILPAEIAKDLRREILDAPVLRELGSALTRRSWRRFLATLRWRQVISVLSLAAAVSWLVMKVAAPPGLRRAPKVHRDLELLVAPDDPGEGAVRLLLTVPAGVPGKAYRFERVESKAPAASFAAAAGATNLLKLAPESGRNAWYFVRSEGAGRDGVIHLSDPATWIPMRTEPPPPPPPVTTSVPPPPENGVLEVVGYPRELTPDWVFVESVKTNAKTAFVGEPMSLLPGRYQVWAWAGPPEEPAPAAPRARALAVGSVVGEVEIAAGRRTVFRFPSKAARMLRLQMNTANLGNFDVDGYPDDAPDDWIVLERSSAGSPASVQWVRGGVNVPAGTWEVRVDIGSTRLRAGAVRIGRGRHTRFQLPVRVREDVQARQRRETPTQTATAAPIATPSPTPTVALMPAPSPGPVISAAVIVVATTTDDMDKDASVSIAISVDSVDVFRWHQDSGKESWRRGSIRRISLDRAADLPVSLVERATISICMTRKERHGWRFDYTGYLVTGDGTRLFQHRGNEIPNGVGSTCVKQPLL